MKILLVDDHPMIRKGLAATLKFEEDVEEIREASNVHEALGILAQYQPDLAVVDLRLGKEDGLEVVSRAKKKDLQTRFIILTSSSKKDDLTRAQEIGVDGYILKDAFAEDIMYAFRVVARGKKFFDSELLQYNQTEKDELRELTPRERDVLIELGKGFSNIQIAQSLYISENTVKKHISSILLKLGLSHRLEAALFINNSVSLEH